MICCQCFWKVTKYSHWTQDFWPLFTISLFAFVDESNMLVATKHNSGFTNLKLRDLKPDRPLNKFVGFSFITDDM